MIDKTDVVTLNDPDWQEKVLTFWFEKLGPEVWFVKDADVDQIITTKFSSLYESLRQRAHGLKATEPRATLAMILVLDQFPRNMFRGSAEAFATDAIALRLSQEAIDQSLDAALDQRERQFLYMPFQHSEDLEVQRRSVHLYEKLGLDTVTDFARRHKEVIERFGRFPHRNAALSRTSTDAEKAYLAEPGSGF